MLLKAVLFFIILEFTLINTEKPVVLTSSGRIQGKVLKTILRQEEYYGFMGIPFAKPPLNENRFLDPQPVEPWSDVLVTTKEKPACSQFNTNIIKGQSFGYYGSEDCLYIDIFTPNTDHKKRNVIVFLYNDHFSNSYNKTKDYAPDFFIEEDVIIVTIGHRLTVFGFLSLEDENVPGNAGLKDIVLGLKWIKSNVEKFGGDSKKISLMGANGGGAAVDLLLHSNAKHLFSSAIIQSGTSWSPAYLQENLRQRAFRLAELLNRASSSNSVLLKDLNDLLPPDLVKKELHANPQDYFKENQKGTLTFGPVVEKHPNGLITKYPEEAHEKINIPVMIGFNSREGLHAALQYLIEPRYLHFIQKDFPFLMPIRVKFRFDPFEDSFYQAIEDIKKYYFKKGKVTYKSIEEFTTYLGDVITGYQVNYVANKYSERTDNNLYYYYFDYYSDLSENKNNILKHSTVEEGTWGAATGDELCYLFYCPSLKSLYLKHNNSISEELVMLRKMVRMWTNFAKKGNPTPDGDQVLEGLKWPTYNTDSKEYLHIDKELKVKTNLCQNRFAFWDNTLKQWEEKAKNGTVVITAIKDEL